MKICRSLLLIFTVLLTVSGCAPQATQDIPAETVQPTSKIGSLIRVTATDPIQVRGIGVVAGLPGTGSSECPANIRADLEKYIWQQVPDKKSVNPRAFIESLDTAVVEVIGSVPSLSSKNDSFNIMVRPLPGTQTTSLDGGYLYTTELKEISRLARVEQFTEYSQKLATGSGPIYSNKMIKPSGENPWYVMGGGKSLQKSFVKLILNSPDYLTANAIRNRINERFGPKVCVPESPSACILYFPPRYTNEKNRFIEIIKSLILTDNDTLRDDYTASAVERLVKEADKNEAEIILEGIGKTAITKIEPLLRHPDEAVRFSAARTMLNIGSDKSTECLRGIAADMKSPYRLEAIKAIGLGSNLRDAKPLLMGAVAEEDIRVKLAAYEMLLHIESPIITRKVVGGGNFVIDSVVCGGPRIIYAYQQDSPRIVLFGSPIQCDKNLFMQSDDGTITLNALPTDKYVSVSRKHPGRPRVIGPLKSSFEVSLLLQTLGDMPEVSDKTGLRPGLAVPYSDILPLLKKMCAQNAIQAQFIAGPEVEMESGFQNSSPSDR